MPPLAFHTLALPPLGGFGAEGGRARGGAVGVFEEVDPCEGLVCENGELGKGGGKEGRTVVRGRKEEEYGRKDEEN